MSASEQETLGDPDSEQAGDATIYIVAANYADDPHPHIEGVFSDPAPAKDLIRDCGKVTQPPHPVAWQLFEAEPGNEVRPQ